jgi:hypothetical protein
MVHIPDTSLKGLLRMRGSCMSLGRRSNNEETTKLAARQPQRRRSLCRARRWGEPRIPPSSSLPATLRRETKPVDSSAVSTRFPHILGILRKSRVPILRPPSISGMALIISAPSVTASRSHGISRTLDQDHCNFAEIVLSVDHLHAWGRQSVCLQH